MVCTIFENEKDFLDVISIIKETTNPNNMVRVYNEGYILYIDKTCALYPNERILVKNWVAVNNFIEAETINDRVVYIPVNNVVAIEKID